MALFAKLRQRAAASDDVPATPPPTPSEPATAPADASAGSPLRDLLTDKAFLKIPKVGEIVHGVIVGIGRNEIRIDIPGYRTGIVRGPELIDASGTTTDLAVGSPVEATVIDLENEQGYVELSFRAAGHQKAWGALDELRRSGAIQSSRVLEANKGGLLVKVGNVQGFLPVSQLSPGNYPRVSGGDKQKILEKLKGFIGKPLDVKIIDVDAEHEKLIVSEKAAWEETQSQVLAAYHAGDSIDGVVTALADFGVFVRFPIDADGMTKTEHHLEGLIHISELSWQRVEHPRDLIAIGDRVRARILNIEGSKIFLSLKRLTEDPWVKAAERFAVGDRVRGKVIKAQPFGLFIELDPQIHGLAHISELGDPPPANPEDIAKVGTEVDCTVISLDPKEHRLGLSVKSKPKDREQEQQAPNPPDAETQSTEPPAS